jgi:hypothetical protein
MNELRNQFRGGDIDAKEFRNRSEELREQQAEARMASITAGINNANNVSSLFSYMNSSSDNSNNGGLWGGGTFDTSVFIQSGAELSNLQAMNSARIGIENRARSLVGEIARDRARGVDVSDRQEALGNLTGNLDILNRNLSNSVDRALADGDGRSGNFVDVVGRIRQSLAPTATSEAEETDAAGTPADAPPSTAAEAASAATAASFANAAAETGAPAEVAPSVAAATPQAPEVVDVNQAIVEDVEPPSYAVPTAFEGNVAEQVTAAAEAPEDGEMSIAAQIAKDSVSSYAESIDIMNDEGAGNAGNAVAAATDEAMN